MKRKWLWGTIVVFILILATAGATVGDTAEPEIKSLSLAQAVEMAMKDNLQVELAALGLEQAELTLEQAKSAARKASKQIGIEIPNMAGGISTIRKDQNMALAIDVIPVQAESGKIIAETGKAYTENVIKFGVEAAYYGVLRAEKMLEVSEASLIRAKEQLKQAEAKFKAGTVAKMEVISAEAQLKTAEAGVNEAKAGVEKARMALNQTLNLNLNTPMELTDKFSFAPAGDIDTDKVFQEMTEKDSSYVLAREKYNINKVNFDYHQKYFTKNTFAYREAEYAFKESEVNLEHAKTQLQLNIKNAYMDLKTAEDNYHVLTKSVEQAKEAYRLTKLRYDVGMATGYDLLGAETALKQADMALLNALYNYNLAKAKFTYGIFGDASAGSSQKQLSSSAAQAASGEMPSGM
jgi:outer membrane protein